jgi:hypothetical protein
MTTAASKGFGTTFVFDGVTIGEVLNFPEVTSELDMTEIFTCDSADETPDYLEGGFNEGVPTFQFIYDGSAAGEYRMLHDKYKAKVRGSLVVTYKNRAGVTSPFTVQAMIASLTWPGFGSPRDAKMATVGFRTLGAKTFADESGGTASSSPSASGSSSASPSASSSV